MTIYDSLSLGSQGEDVKKLQQSLLNAGYELTVDGDYGEQTQSAVMQYQTDNGLNADGVAGSDTLSRLYGGSSFEGYDASTNEAYMQAIEALRQHSQSVPTYANSFEEELQSLYQQIVGRESFSYDASADALYQQYKEQYLTKGLQAMEDTMAQAAHLTGGYGSTYAQGVGQQQYGSYMRELTALMPQLYDRALNTYNAEGDRLLSNYELLNSQANEEYSRYQDALSQYNTQLDYLSDQAQNAYDTGFENWQAANAERDNAYNKLTELMGYSGYVPTVDDLEASGMTRAQADAYLKAWKAANPLLAWQTGAITAEEYMALTGSYPPGYSSGGGYYYGSSKKKETEEVNKFDIVNERARIEADYNAGRIDYDDREQLVNKLYGW